MFKKSGFIFLLLAIALTLLLSLSKKFKSSKVGQKIISNLPPLMQPKATTVQGKTTVKQMYKDRFPDIWAAIVTKFGNTVLANCYFAQTMLETGQYKSNLYLNANNLMGMRCVQKRPTTQIGCTPSGFGQYENVNQCIRDMELYYNYFNYPSSYINSQAYVRTLKSKNYFSASESGYLSAINSFMI